MASLIPMPAAPPKIDAAVWSTVLEGRAAKPPVSWRELARRTGVSRPSLQAKWKRHEAVEREARRAERAAKAAEPKIPDGALVLPAGTRVIGAYEQGGGLEIQGSELYPGAVLTHTAFHTEYDGRGRIDLSDRIRARSGGQ
jgi:hypothetical protein